MTLTRGEYRTNGRRVKRVLVWRGQSREKEKEEQNNLYITYIYIYGERERSNRLKTGEIDKNVALIVN